MGKFAPNNAKCLEKLMRSKFNSVFALATAAAVMFGGVSTAIAATISVTSVGGTWASTDPSNPPGLAGIGTNAVSWGIPLGSHKSGYSFVGAAAGQIETGVDFDLGTFTHNNFVIRPNSSIRGAGLGVIVNLVVGGVAQAVNAAFNFEHWETDNSPRHGGCANGGANRVGVNASGCADRVTITDNSASQEKFVIDGFEYILEITGFTRAGQLFSAFWTEENKANSAVLRARFTLVGPTNSGGNGEPNPNPNPTPSPVPLPAAGWMVLTGLGALAAARARKKA
jgi:hypothetical protein